MNDREVLQALLDGKVITEGWNINPLIYRLNGKWMEDRDRTHGWSRTGNIPKLDPDRVKIVEEEEWTQENR